MRLHLLRDLAKMYAPKILKEVDKKRRERLHKRKLDSRLTLSTTLYNNKSNRMEFSSTTGSNLNASKSEVSGVGAGLNESQSMDATSKTQPTDTNDLTEVTAAGVEPVKSSKPKRKLSAGQCMKPMNSTVNVKEEPPKPKKRRGSKSSAKSEEEGGLKDGSKPTLLVEKIDEVDENNVKVEANVSIEHRKSLPATPVKTSTATYDNDPFNINSPRPVSDPNISFTADTQPNTETEQPGKIDADLAAKTDVEVKVEAQVVTEEQKPAEDEKSSSNSSSSSSSEADKHESPAVQAEVDVDAQPASTNLEVPPATVTVEGKKPRDKKKPTRPKVKKVDHKKNQQKIHKFFKSLRPKKKKKGLVAEPEMDPGVPEKAN